MSLQALGCIQASSSVLGRSKLSRSASYNRSLLCFFLCRPAFKVSLHSRCAQAILVVSLCIVSRFSCRRASHAVHHHSALLQRFAFGAIVPFNGLARRAP